MAESKMCCLACEAVLSVNGPFALVTSLPPCLGMDLLGYWRSVKSHLTFSTAQEEACEVKAACLSASGQQADTPAAVWF